MGPSRVAAFALPVRDGVKIREARGGGGGAPGPGAMNAVFDPPRPGSDWRSRDGPEVDAYVAAPLGGFALEAAARAWMLNSASAARLDHRLAQVRRDLPI